MSELQKKPQSNIGAVINWVAATSLKPNHENAVLVRCREFGDTEYRYVYMTAQYVKHCKQWFVMSHNEEFQYDIVVSHWAEIPEPPCL